jgi:topoisomerase-4 subunit A
MSDRFGRYSKYIIQERALPDARDGLKPVQRRILYAMHHDGNTYDKAHRKSAKTVGLVIGNYHPHGDTSVYDAMVRLSQDWKIREPLIDMHGNNGSIDDDPAAAMRYTEARLSKISSTMCEDLDKETVLLAPNFDDTEMEPTVLPARFPMLLVNGCTGIAAGYATNMAPHNLNEVVDATIHRINHPNCSLETLMGILKGPDFPTGGIVMGKAGLMDAYRTGKGKVLVRAKAEIVDSKTCRQIVITEIPYEVVKCQLVKKMDDIRLNKDIEGILDVRDESDRNGLKIVVDVKKDMDAQFVLNYFYKNTDLQISYNFNNVGIVNQRPVQMSLMNMLDAFIDFRKEVVLKRSKYLYEKMQKRCHVLEGLMKAVSILDEVIAVIRASKDKADAKKNLCEKFYFTETQAEAIVVLRLYRLTNTDVVQLKNEYAELVAEMERLKTILGSDAVLCSVIVKELKEIKKEFGTDRRTEIQDEIQEIVIDKLSMIPNERVRVTVSKDGYVKRVSLRSFASSDPYATGLKESDQLIGSLECDTLDTLLLYTKLGNYGVLPVYQVDEAKWKDVGSHMNKVIKCSAEDKIINAVCIKNFETYAWIITISKSGAIKKTPVNQWNVTRNNRIMTAMKLKKDDELLKAFVAYEDDHVLLVTKGGYSSRYPVSSIPSTSVKAQGVKAINLSKGDDLASACILSKDTTEVVLISSKGSMKRLKVNDLPVTNRPVKGELLVKKLKTHPYEIIDVIAGSLYDQFVMSDEKIHEFMFKDISLMAKDATFSTPVSFTKNFCLTRGIEEVRIVDIPENAFNEVVEETESVESVSIEVIEDEQVEMNFDDLDSVTTFVQLEDDPDNHITLMDFEDEEPHGDFEIFTLFDDDIQ